MGSPVFRGCHLVPSLLLLLYTRVNGDTPLGCYFSFVLILCRLQFKFCIHKTTSLWWKENRSRHVTSRCHGSKIFGWQQTDKVTLKSIRTISNFTDLVQFHLIWQMLAEFSLGPHLSFYVVVVQRRHGYAQNSVIHVESCCLLI